MNAEGAKPNIRGGKGAILVPLNSRTIMVIKQPAKDLSYILRVKITVVKSEKHQRDRCVGVRSIRGLDRKGNKA